jgi:FkbM family methyltransferase
MRFDHLSLTLLRLRKLAFGLRSRLGRRALRQGAAASVEHAAALGGNDFSTIVDVGANRGQFALFSRIAFPRARIISFEPLPAAIAVFRRVFNGCDGVVLHPVATGATKGRVEFHVASDDDSSSVLPIGSYQTKTFGTRQSAAIEVDVERLDEILAPSDIVAPALLKIDVQGYEKEVLQGCGRLIKQFDVVYVEASFVELYSNQVLVDELLNLLADAGFGLRGVFNQVQDMKGVPIQADFIFRRMPHRAMSGPGNSPKG